MCHPRAVVPLLSIIEVLAAIIGDMVNVNVASPDNDPSQSVNTASTEYQQSINNLGYCTLYNPRAVLQHLPIINVLAAFMGQIEGDMVTAPV